MARNPAFEGGFGLGITRSLDRRLKERALDQDVLSQAVSQVGALGDNIANIIGNSPDRDSIPRDTIDVLARTGQEIIGELRGLPGGQAMARIAEANLNAKLSGAVPRAEKLNLEVQNKVGAAVALVEAARDQPEEVQRMLGTLPKEARGEFDRALDAAVDRGLIPPEEADTLRVDRLRSVATEQGPSTIERLRQQIAEQGLQSLTEGQRQVWDAHNREQENVVVEMLRLLNGGADAGGLPQRIESQPEAPVAPPPPQQPAAPQNPAPLGSAPGPAPPAVPIPSQPQPQAGGANVPPRPSTVPSGSAWSPSRRMWRDPAGRLYDENGNPAGG